MDIWRPITMNKARALIGVIQYYRDMCPIQSQIYCPLIEAASGPKGRKMPWNYILYDPFK